METIAAAACVFSFKDSLKDDLIVHGQHHSDCISWLAFADIPQSTIDKSKTQQGFITNLGRFVNREEAYQIAKTANQLTSERIDGVLYSEYVQYKNTI